MTLNDKLDHFYTSVIDSATAQYIEIVEEYKKTLLKISDDRRNAAVKKAESTFQVESDIIKREKNRRLSNVSVEIKRKTSEKAAEIKDQIFGEVERKLKEFMQSTAYEDYLAVKIKEASEFAQGNVIIIYINPSDQYMKASLESRTGVTLTISNRDFFGGIRAVLPSRSILIDNSFLTKLAEEKNSFKLLV
jgi:vacuolar-type H+-ATPase subunit E/Vma4